MTNIVDYDHGYGLTTKISAGKMSPALTAKTEVTFDMGKLTPRMRTMLINQFLRGYKNTNQWGQLFEFTDMLCFHFGFKSFPTIISNTNGIHVRYSDPTEKIQQWLQMTALVNNITYRNEMYGTEASLVYNTKEQPITNGKIITTSIIEYLNEEDGFVPIEARKEVIKFIEKCESFTLCREYK